MINLLDRVQCYFLILVGLYFVGHDLAVFCQNLPFYETHIYDLYRLQFTIFGERNCAIAWAIAFWIMPLFFGWIFVNIYCTQNNCQESSAYS